MLNNLDNKKIILASKSPRRQELLKGLDIEFEVKTKDVDESFPDTIPLMDVPVYISEKKAEAFKEELVKNAIIITSDTIVIQDGRVLEKPKSHAEAIEMITLMNAKKHMVVTGVCIQSLTKKVTFSDQTIVHFNKLDNEEITYYVNKYKPFDKAGAYGVQEWIGYIGIKHLEGSYYNVMGLPVHKLYEALKSF